MMRRNLLKTGAALVACAMSVWTIQARADVTVSSTSHIGTIEEFAPGADFVVRTESSTDPVRYSVSGRTVYVDETGAPVAVQQISRGTPVTVHTVREGDRVIADRVIVRRAPVTTEQRTTTTTTRKLTDDEQDALEERIEKKKERLEKLEDELEDDD